jgi:L-seryl-tRNA(Ser) seleniumtransferase
MSIVWDQTRIKLDPKDASKQLRSGTPSIVIENHQTGLAMNSFMLQPGEEKIIAEHLVQLFHANSA